ncbi:glycosyltransferase [Candidatus Halobeggiatoa sp. HSG11]|nr:glycosyltransferase [Candidatus Halobeggiatoa sp. HSG11]
MKTSLIIPFKNEKYYAALTIRTVYAYLSKQAIEFEIIAVDDSDDGTWDILQTLTHEYPNMILAKGVQPAGYGTALQVGFQLATGEIIIPFNGDLSDSLDDVMSYIHLIEKQGYSMVFGSRFMQGAKVENVTGLKNNISWLANKFLQLLFISPCSDITNSFKGYRKEVLQTLNPSAKGYHIGMELALKGMISQYRYTTIPISWTNRRYGRSKMSVLKVIPDYLLMAFKIRFSQRKNTL